MKRRDFLKLGAAGALAAGLSGATGCSVRHRMSPADRRLMAGLRIIDAHAHPYQLYLPLPLFDPTMPTIEEMEDANVVCCAWAAVPDRKLERLHWHDTPFEDTLDQLNKARIEMNKGDVRLVTKAADIPAAVGPGRPPGALLAVEGGDALEGQIDKLDLLYKLGVRMMTLVHYTPNALGDIMTKPPKAGRTDCLRPPLDRRNGCLTRFGREVVEKMVKLGMIIDVSHANDGMLETVVKIAKKRKVPLVDSHSNPYPRNIPYKCSRLRSWPSMKLVAESGGVVCTWPMAYWGRTVPKTTSCSIRENYLWPNVPEPTVNDRPESYWRHDRPRETFDDWAREIKRMMEFLGSDHVGLGTDGGGMIDYLIGGYGGYTDLPKLVRAMKRAGLSSQKIEAYLGGNFARVLHRVLG